MSPDLAKIRFKMLTVENLALIAAIYIPGAFLLSKYWFAWPAQIALMTVLYCVFVRLLEHRAIGLECPHCRKHISTNSPWICGVCQKLNLKPSQFPFLHQCEHCHVEPKAYMCHHRICGKLIFLSKDELETNYARCIKGGAADQGSKEMREEEKETVEHNIVMAELTAKLNAAKQRQELDRKKTPKERLLSSFEDHQASSLGAEEIAREKRAEIMEKYKDDPELRERALFSINEWLKDQTHRI